jgi:pantoate--beta-alanine ligase
VPVSNLQINDGTLTVSRAQVFGRKDYQQFQLLCRMVRDLDLGVRMVGAPLLREPDGLALSSRNVRLSPAQRTAALSISASLRACAHAVAAGERRAGALTAAVRAAVTAAGGEVDYCEAATQEELQRVEALAEGDRLVLLVAARFGSVRLLDNLEIEVSGPSAG